MAKAKSSSKKAATSKAANAVNKLDLKKAIVTPGKNLDIYDPAKPLTGVKVGKYADTWDPAKPGSAKAKNGLYMDTWLPQGNLPAEVGIYADTWISAVKIIKGAKGGMYADT